jgi:hypothetical protein
LLLHDQLHSERTQRDKLATATTRRVPPAQLALDLDNKPARAVEAPEYSPLEAPRLPFSSRGYGRASPTSSARTSSSSLSSLASSSGSRRYSAGRSDLTAQQSQQQQQRVGLGYHSPGASPSDSVQSLPRVDEDMAGFNTYDDHDGAAQEELLDESERPSHHPKQNGNLDPYAWERPLDAVNRVRPAFPLRRRKTTLVLIPFTPTSALAPVGRRAGSAERARLSQVVTTTARVDHGRSVRIQRRRGDVALRSRLDGFPSPGNHGPLHLRSDHLPDQLSRRSWRLGSPSRVLARLPRFLHGRTARRSRERLDCVRATVDEAARFKPRRTRYECAWAAAGSDQKQLVVTACGDEGHVAETWSRTEQVVGRGRSRSEQSFSSQRPRRFVR